MRILPALLLLLASCVTTPRLADQPPPTNSHQALVEKLLTELHTLPGPARFLRVHTGPEFRMVLADLDEEGALTVVSDQSGSDHTFCIDLPPYGMVDGCARRGGTGSIPIREAQKYYMKIIEVVSRPRT